MRLNGFGPSSQLESINRELLAAIADADYAGYDPFDTLNSPLLKRLPLYRSAWFRLAFLQLGKRLPVDLRPLLRVPKARNPKGVALCILALLQDFQRTGSAHFLAEAHALGRWLINQRSAPAHWQHPCWGYHFDWQARAFFVPAGKPNVITTCYVARALYALGETADDDALRKPALESARFISASLFTQLDGEYFYAYIPGETALIHNANLWGAAWCAFAGRRLGDSAMIEQALLAAQTSLQAQRSDGSWWYGTRAHHQFIDGFHTGYMLEALYLLRGSSAGSGPEPSPEPSPEPGTGPSTGSSPEPGPASGAGSSLAASATTPFDEAIESAYRHYKKTFLSPEGDVNYFHNSPYPRDIHSVAQAVLTLLVLGPLGEVLPQCERILQRAVQNLYLPQHRRFVYQKGRWLTNRMNYLRWSQAWAYYAIASYLRHREEAAYDATV